MIPTIGQTLHFYRDKDFPGKRGPYAATIIGLVERTDQYSIISAVPNSQFEDCLASREWTYADLSVIGETGQTFTEYSVPFLSGQFDPPDTRYCTNTIVE